jgi:hypothetical protein
MPCWRGGFPYPVTVHTTADPLFEMNEAFDAAKSILGRSDEESIRYSALELRRCIEAIVYGKLKIYQELLPGDSIHQWQPPQAFDALLAVDPSAEDTFMFAVGPQTEFDKMSSGPFTTIGVDHRPRSKWLKKTWNKLGHMVHAEWPFAKSGPSQQGKLDFLRKTLQELDPYVRSGFSSNLSLIVTFECVGCGRPAKSMERVLRKAGATTCLTCGTPYRAEEVDGEFRFFASSPPWKCDCGAATYIPPRQVRIGYTFACRTCKKEFKVVGQQWVVAESVEAGAAEDESEE